MNRRRFLSLAGLGVSGIALGEAIPLGRVWSFPKKIVCLNLQSPDAADEAFNASLLRSQAIMWELIHRVREHEARRLRTIQAESLGSVRVVSLSRDPNTIILDSI